ncbi:hypothetical protein MCOR25_010506 [Pyricularia grisea]|nr:hypothetical protein MCOR25_010506 [Pyricularia grisea]
MMPPLGLPGTWRLPIGENHWLKLIEKFRLPRIFSPETLMSRQINITCFTCPDPSDTNNKLLMAMATTSADYPVPGAWQQLAMCSTHWVSRRLTHCLFTHLNENQMDKVEELLNSAVSEGVAEHPCLTLGITMELMLQRLIRLQHNLRQKSAEVEVSLAMFSPDKNMARHNHFDTEYLDRIYQVRKHTDLVLKEISTTRRHLIRTMERCSPAAWSGDARTGEQVVDTRFRQRFEDIVIELDDLTSRVQSSLDYLIQQVTKMNSIFTQHEIMSSGMTAENGRRIAFMAILYLPISTIATIFAMPIFKFENDWRDIFMHPVPRSEDDDASAKMPVVSGYVWYYVVLSMVLTCITTAVLLFGHRFKRRRDHRTEAVVEGAVKAGQYGSTALTITENLRDGKGYWSFGPSRG